MNEDLDRQIRAQLRGTPKVKQEGQWVGAIAFIAIVLAIMWVADLASSDGEPRRSGDTEGQYIPDDGYVP